MNSNEKALSRIRFQNKVYKSDGQAFEDLFTEIMSYAVNGFRKIEAWGNLGDFKNDGYIPDKGIYFQVYAPKDIRNSYRDLINKIDQDFHGLNNKWNGIKEYYFVINDKFNGVNPESEQVIKALKNKHGLSSSDFFTSNNLEHTLFGLDDDQILSIVGSLPNPDLLRLDYSIVTEVIGFIMRLPLTLVSGEIKFPDWNEKIEFNGLSQSSKYFLDHGSQQLGSLEQYLEQNTTLSSELQKHVTGLYEQIGKEWKEYHPKGDNILWELIQRCAPKQEQHYQNAVLTILAKYFESCDIFEEPQND
ncbi:MAG: ABC-three component system protein [Bacteroidota bacterium]